MEVPEAQIPSVISTSVLIYTIALVASSYVAGKLSDKIGKRKVCVWSSTALFAVGTFALIYVYDVPTFCILEAVLGLAYGIYVGVDLALVVDVLPNPEDSAKDLGVLNIANALPQSLASVVGVALLAMGGQNYLALFIGAAVIGVLGAITILPVRSKPRQNTGNVHLAHH